MGVIDKYLASEESLFEELKSLVWVGVSKATLDSGKKTLFYSTLICNPEFWEKLTKDPSFEPKEMQNLLNVLLAKFTVILAAYLRPSADGVPLNLRSLISLSEFLDRLMEVAVEDADIYDSHLKAEKGEQDSPFFLRYDRTLVEGRFFDAISEASLSGEVLPTKRVNELLAGCSPREVGVLKEKLEEINNLVAGLKLREASKDDIANQLSDLFDDFFTQTEP